MPFKIANAFYFYKHFCGKKLTIKAYVFNRKNSMSDLHLQRFISAQERDFEVRVHHQGGAKQLDVLALGVLNRRKLVRRCTRVHCSHHHPKR